MSAKKRAAVVRPPIVVGRGEKLGGKLGKGPAKKGARVPAVVDLDGPEVEDVEAERKRAEVFSFEPYWKEQPLEAFSVSRETLFLQIREANGAPELYSCARSKDSWYPDAVRILYLCLHTPKDWGMYRGDLRAFQEMLIDPWADANLQSGRDKVDLDVLTFKIWNASQELRAEPLPDETPRKGPRLGN